MSEQAELVGHHLGEGIEWPMQRLGAAVHPTVQTAGAGMPAVGDELLPDAEDFDLDGKFGRVQDGVQTRGPEDDLGSLPDYSPVLDLGYYVRCSGCGMKRSTGIFVSIEWSNAPVPPRSARPTSA